MQVKFGTIMANSIKLEKLQLEAALTITGPPVVTYSEYFTKN